MLGGVAIIFPLFLALITLYVGKVAWIERIIPTHRWMSLGAGVSIAYVFLDILPELNVVQTEIEHTGGLAFLEKHAYLLALLGLGLFYGVEWLAMRSRRYNLKLTGQDCTTPAIFWVHIGVFCLYNALIGELLSDTEARGLTSTILLSIALGLHFLITDRGLRRHHKQPYDRVGRWILAGAILVGWIVGRSLILEETAIAVLWGLVAGGLILNVLKEELPETKESCLGSFLIGAGGYAALLLTIE
ncbi:MAG: hypothetical protein F6K03_14925 [Kamptonema sp. SIO4C4]|nr:hypothetical protein [Kamptonema sp. SIO4C4]